MLCHGWPANTASVSQTLRGAGQFPATMEWWGEVRGRREQQTAGCPHPYRSLQTLWIASWGHRIATRVWALASASSGAFVHVHNTPWSIP